VAQWLDVVGRLLGRDVALIGTWAGGMTSDWTWVAGQVSAGIGSGVLKGIQGLGMVLDWFRVLQRMARLPRMMRVVKNLGMDRNMRSLLRELLPCDYRV